MSETEPAAGPNADQETYWSSAVGERWVSCQEQLDAAFRPVNELVIARARPASGEAVLDVGCGAGATTRALAARVGPNGSVLGIDISHVLLGRAEELRQQAGLDRVTHRHADAQTHAFTPGAFDLLASRFGVMFFADPVAAFANLRGALRPGARVAFACWADFDANPWFAVPQAAVAEVLGEAARPPLRAPGPFAFAETGYVVDILRQAGFAHVTADTEAMRLTPKGDMDAVTELMCSVGPVTRAMREFAGDEEHLAEIARRIAEAFRQYEDADGIRIPASINIFAATKR